MPEWREGKINNVEKALGFLTTYRWSSLPDYMGRNNFPTIINKKILLEQAGGTRNIIRGLDEYIRSMNLKPIINIIL